MWNPYIGRKKMAALCNSLCLFTDGGWSEWCPCTEEGGDWHRYGLRHGCGQVSLRDGPRRWQLLIHSGCGGRRPSYLQQYEAVHKIPHLLQRGRGGVVSVLWSKWQTFSVPGALVWVLYWAYSERLVYICIKTINQYSLKVTTRFVLLLLQCHQFLTFYTPVEGK